MPPPWPDMRVEADLTTVDGRLLQACANSAQPCTDLVLQGERALALVGPALERVPRAFGWALCALDLQLAPPREIAIVGDREAPVARAALAAFDPRAVVAIGPSDDVALLAGKGLLDGRTAVYVCERFACRAPATDPADLV